MLHRLVALAIATTLTLLGSASAYAAGRLPAATGVVVDPHDGRTIYVRSTFGFLVTHDAGDSWRWLCGRGLGFAADEDPAWTVTREGTLVVGAANGGAVSRDGGCSLTRHPHALKAIATRPTGELVGVADGRLLLSNDDARTFAPYGAQIDPLLSVETIALAPSDRGRIYVGVTQGEGEARSAGLLASYDGGMSWSARRLDLAGRDAPAAISVAPKNADRIYVRTRPALDGPARLLVTDDAGKTWTKVHESVAGNPAFALSDDGGRVFVGGREGVASSPTDTFAFTKGSSADVQCLGASGNTLWACSTERSGFFVGVSRSGGRSFEAKLRIDEIKGPVACGPESQVAKLCAEDWPKLRRELGLPEADEKPRSGGQPSGPALRGQAQRTGRGGSTRIAVLGIALFGFAAYSILKRLRRR